MKGRVLIFFLIIYLVPVTDTASEFRMNIECYVENPISSKASPGVYNTNVKTDDNETIKEQYKSGSIKSFKITNTVVFGCLEFWTIDSYKYKLKVTNASSNELLLAVDPVRIFVGGSKRYFGMRGESKNEKINVSLTFNKPLDFILRFDLYGYEHTMFNALGSDYTTTKTSRFHFRILDVTCYRPLYLLSVFAKKHKSSDLTMNMTIVNVKDQAILLTVKDWKCCDRTNYTIHSQHVRIAMHIKVDSEKRGKWPMNYIFYDNQHREILKLRRTSSFNQYLSVANNVKLMCLRIDDLRSINIVIQVVNASNRETLLNFDSSITAIYGSPAYFPLKGASKDLIKISISSNKGRVVYAQCVIYGTGTIHKTIDIPPQPGKRTITLDDTCIAPMRVVFIMTTTPLMINITIESLRLQQKLVFNNYNLLGNNYSNKFSMHQCNPGFYSKNCLPCGKCKVSEQSAYVIENICHPFTGECLSKQCDLNYEGSRCDRCIRNYYGRNCQYRCGHCLDIDYCHPTTGHCPECAPGYIGNKCDLECAPGRYGDKCEEECSSNCDGMVCHFITGNCSTCKPGWKGGKCETPQECGRGWYGTRCNLNCSNCIDGQCELSSGKCILGCILGFRGPYCRQPCPPGSYGKNCDEMCGVCHNFRICNSTTGNCDNGCAGNFIPPLCKVCPSGWFGGQCDEKCGHCKGGVTCDNFSGSCPEGCAEGYMGPFCRHRIEEWIGREDL